MWNGWTRFVWAIWKSTDSIYHDISSLCALKNARKVNEKSIIIIPTMNKHYHSLIKPIVRFVITTNEEELNMSIRLLLNTFSRLTRFIGYNINKMYRCHGIIGSIIAARSWWVFWMQFQWNLNTALTDSKCESHVISILYPLHLCNIITV